MNIVFINGQFVEKANASISIFDRGFLFGDALYEVIPIIEGKPHSPIEHLKRLNTGLKEMHIAPPYTDEQWSQVISSLLTRNTVLPCCSDAHIYLQVSRGIEPTRAHRLPMGIKPSVVVFLQQNKQTNFNKEVGTQAITLLDPRRRRCNLKSTSLIANIMALHTAQESNAQEAILCNDDGFALEGTQSNLFVVHGDTISTPQLTSRIVPGVTREILVNALRADGLTCEERDITKDELFEASEIWLTGSIKGIYSVVSLDGRTIGTGKPGPIWNRALKILHQKSMIVST